MAQQNQTEVKVVVNVKNRQELDLLKKSVNELAKASGDGTINLEDYLEKIKEVSKTSGQSINSLNAQKKLWETVRKAVDGSSAAYAVASREIRNLNGDLSRIQRSYTNVSDAAGKAAKSITSASVMTARYLGKPVSGYGGPTVQEVVAQQGPGVTTPTAMTRSYLGLKKAETDEQRTLNTLAREHFGITGLSQNLQRQLTKAAQDEAAAHQRSVNIIREKNKEIMSGLRTQALADIGGRLEPGGGGLPALPPYQERGLQQLTGGINLAPGAAELSAARRRTRVAQLRLQRQRAEQRARLAENIGLGVGFPALFGAGAGSIIGSGLGSFVGQGFAGQIAGGAIGQKFDELIQSQRDFAVALREGGDAAGYLREKLGYLDPETSNLISNLQKSGQTARAAEVALKTLGKTIGEDNAQQYRDAGEAADLFFRGAQIGWTKLIAKTTAYLKTLEDIKIILGPGQELDLKGLFGEVAGQAPRIQEDPISKAAQRRVADLKDQNALLQAQGNAARFILGTDSENYEVTQKQVAKSEKIVEYNQIIRDYKEGILTIDEKIEKVKGLELKHTKRIAEIDRQVQEQDRRDAERLRVRIAKAFVEQLEVGTRIQEVERTIANYSRTELDNAVERVAELDKIEQREKLVLSAKYGAALEEAKINNTVQETKDLYQAQYELLQAQQKERRMQRKEAEILLRLNEQMAIIDARAGVAGARMGYAGEIAGLRAGLAFTGAGEFGYQQEALRVEQGRRYLEEVAKPQHELAQQRLAIDNLIKEGNKTQADLLQLQVDKKQELLDVSQKELMTIFQLEEQQLRLTEHLRQFGGVYNAIGSGMTNMFDLLIEGSESWGDSLRNIAATVLKDIARQLIQIFVIEQSIGFLRSVFAPAAPGAGAGDAIAQMNASVRQYGFAGGGIMTPRGPLSLKRYAGGGIANSPQLAMFGEGSRPEAYVPLPDGRSIPVTIKNGKDGNGINVNVNVDAAGSEVSGNNDQAGQLGKAIGLAVQQELIKQKRPGGLLAGV